MGINIKQGLGQKTFAYVVLLLGFYLCALGLDFFLSSWLKNSKLLDDLISHASLVFAVWLASRVGDIGYLGVGVVALVGICGLILYMLLYLSQPDSSIIPDFEHLEFFIKEFWVEFLGYIVVACATLMVVNQLTKHSGQQPPAARTPDGAA